nr:transporter substrate-binding domain-containing protein [Kordiimonas marina]
MLSFILGVVGLAVPAVAADSLTITYYDYPPKMTIVGGKPAGARIDQMTEIVEAAGLKVRWLKASISQEADMLNAGKRTFCATGRSYTPDRAKRWVFLPYYLDALSEHVIVARTEDAARIRKLKTVSAVLADKSLTGVLLQNYLYGPVVDPILAKGLPWVSRQANMVVQEIDMIRLGRAHYTIVPVQSWRAYQKANDGARGLVSIDTFGAMPRDSLYIACSRALDAATIAALENAMASLGYRPVDFDKLPKAP